MVTTAKKIDPDLNTVCPVCKYEAKLSQVLKSREVKPDLKEIGTECPKCNTFVHSYFISGELEKRTAEIRSKAELVRLNKTQHLLRAYRDMQVRFQRDFDELNKKLREKYKVTTGKPSVTSWSVTA